jgi:hypothetical protein
MILPCVLTLEEWGYQKHLKIFLLKSPMHRQKPSLKLECLEGPDGNLKCIGKQSICHAMEVQIIYR